MYEKRNFNSNSPYFIKFFVTFVAQVTKVSIDRQGGQVSVSQITFSFINPNNPNRQYVYLTMSGIDYTNILTNPAFTSYLVNGIIIGSSVSITIGFYGTVDNSQNKLKIPILSVEACYIPDTTTTIGTTAPPTSALTSAPTSGTSVDPNACSGNGIQAIVSKNTVTISLENSSF